MLVRLACLNWTLHLAFLSGCKQFLVGLYSSQGLMGKVWLPSMYATLQDLVIHRLWDEGPLFFSGCSPKTAHCSLSCWSQQHESLFHQSVQSKKVIQRAVWQDRSHSLSLASHGSDIPSNFSDSVNSSHWLPPTLRDGEIDKSVNTCWQSSYGTILVADFRSSLPWIWLGEYYKGSPVDFSKCSLILFF